MDQRSGRLPAAPTVSGVDVDKTFWFGDADGGLFRVHLDHVEVDASGAQLRVTGTATNLLEVGQEFRAAGAVRAAGAEEPLIGGSSERARPGESVPVRLTAAEVPVELDLSTVTLVFGAEGTNQSVVPLDPAVPLISEAPTEAIVGTETLPLPYGANFHVTRSLLYPRYESGRIGQHRLKVYLKVSMDPAAPDQMLLLHPSLTSPDGFVQSIGDQVATPPEASFTESAILDEPMPGTYTMTMLEMVSRESTSLTFGVP